MSRATGDFLPVVLRDLEVAALTDLTPRLRRVSLRGAELEARVVGGRSLTAFHSPAFDDHVKVFLPDETGRVVLPIQRDGFLEWPDFPPAIARDYTVRRFDPVQGVLELDIIRHGDGVGGRWCSALRVGDRVHLAGPRDTAVHPVDVHHVLIGDESALPAIARWLDEAGPASTASIFLAVGSVDDEIALPHGDGVQISWVHRDGSPEDEGALDTSALLAALTDTVFPDDVYVWLAGEAGLVNRVRRHLVRDRGVAPGDIQVEAYWRRRSPVADDAVKRIRAMTELRTPFAIRVASSLGLPGLIQQGVTTTVGLAAATGTDPFALDALVGSLVGDGVFTRDGDEFDLTELGRALAEDVDLQTELDLESAEGHMERAWPGLMHTVRTATSGYAHVFGRPFWEATGSDPKLAASFDEYISSWSDAWIPDVVAAGTWISDGHLVDVGGGSGRLLAAILQRQGALTGSVVELGAVADAATEYLAQQGLADRATACAGSFFDPLPEADQYVLAQVLHDWPDAEAVQILRRCRAAARAGARITLVERIANDAAHDHASMTLFMLVLFGGRERTLEQYRQLAHQAGFELVSHAPSKEGRVLHLIELVVS